MQRIYSITEQSCREHYGKPVLVFTNDGSEITGILSRVGGGKLVLNDKIAVNEDSVVKTSRKKADIKVRTGKRKGKAGVIAAFHPAAGPEPFRFGGGPGFGAPPITLDVNGIVALFVLV